MCISPGCNLNGSLIAVRKRTGFLFFGAAAGEGTRVEIGAEGRLLASWREKRGEGREGREEFAVNPRRGGEVEAGANVDGVYWAPLRGSGLGHSSARHALNFTFVM